VRALVVYESMYGNTEAIARAVAEGLSASGAVEVVEVVEVSAAPVAIPAGVDLLVVGGPTHAHGMTRPDSRRSAAAKTEGRVISPGIGIREWLDAVRGGATGGVAAAAFDTRLKGPAILWGSAAKAAAAHLQRLGFREAARPESFLVGGPTGPVHDALVAGEVERARRWGEGLAAGLAAGAR